MRREIAVLLRNYPIEESGDALEALARQFDYPYVPAGEQRFSSRLVAAHDPFGRAAEMLRDEDLADTGTGLVARAGSVAVCVAPSVVAPSFQPRAPAASPPASRCA